MTRFFSLFLLISTLTACSYIKPIGSTLATPFEAVLDPLIYKLTIQQGNIIDQEQIDKLKLGMSKEQVSFVLGTPMVKDAFDADRWEYPYHLTPSRGEEYQKNLVVIFKEDKLHSVSGDFETDKISGN